MGLAKIWRILLANSGQATSRANRDVRVAARGTPLQPVRDPARGSSPPPSPRAAGAPSPRPGTAPAAARTTAPPARSSPRSPLASRTAAGPPRSPMNDRIACSASYCSRGGSFRYRPCFAARVHRDRTGQARQSDVAEPDRHVRARLRLGVLLPARAQPGPAGQRTCSRSQSIAKSLDAVRPLGPVLPARVLPRRADQPDAVLLPAADQQLGGHDSRRRPGARPAAAPARPAPAGSPRCSSPRAPRRWSSPRA